MVDCAFANRRAARHRVHRSHPAMDAPVEEELASFGKLGRQGVETHLLDAVIRDIGKLQGGIACDQKAERTGTAKIVPRTFIVDAAAVEGIEHPPGAIHMSRQNGRSNSSVARR